jgi:predicted GNAT family N-acyltransferase
MSPPAQFRPIAWGSPEYQLELALRDEVLRRPLGLRLSPADTGGEENQFHFGLFGPGDALLACLLAVPVDGRSARFRQMAVRADQQGRGLGRQLLLAAEDDLSACGRRTFTLHARATAIGFYARLGYRLEGPGFTEVGIPHRLMVKELG